MVRLPAVAIDTAVADAIYAVHEREREDWRRPHLGASQIGKKCTRYLWMTFRWAADPTAKDTRAERGRLLRLFRRGDREEVEVVRELKKVPGLTVLDVDPKTGKQWRIDFAGGHYGGSMDGRILGVPAAPKTWHVLEIKTYNAKRFDDLVRRGVQDVAPDHYAQTQAYMRASKLTRALYVAVCKDDDRIYTERIRLDREFADYTVRRADLVVLSRQPLERIKNDPTWWECKMCPFHATCQMGRVEQLERNCRTCLSATPRDDGTWWCEHYQRPLSLGDQRAGCDAHLFVPGLLPWEAVDADEASRSVTYDAGNGARVVDRGKQLLTVQ